LIFSIEISKDNELNYEIDYAKEEIKELNEKIVVTENKDCTKVESTQTNKYAIDMNEDKSKNSKFEEYPKVITTDQKNTQDSTATVKHSHRTGKEKNDTTNKDTNTCTNTLDLSIKESRPINKSLKDMEIFASLEDMIIVGSNPDLDIDNGNDTNYIENDDCNQIPKEDNNSKRLFENNEYEVDGKTIDEHENKYIESDILGNKTLGKTETSSKENDEDISNRLVLNHWDDMWDTNRLKANRTHNKDKVEANSIEKTIVKQLSSTTTEQYNYKPKLTPKPRITLNGPNVRFTRRNLQKMGPIPETQVIPAQTSSAATNSQQKLRKFKSEVRMIPSEGAKQNIGTIKVVEPKTSTPKSANPYKVRVQIFGRSPGPPEQKEARENSELYQSGSKISWLQKMAVKKSL